MQQGSARRRQRRHESESPTVRGGKAVVAVPRYELKAASATAESIAAAAGEAHEICMDVADSEVGLMGRATRERYGRIDARQQTAIVGCGNSVADMPEDRVESRACRQSDGTVAVREARAAPDVRPGLWQYRQRVVGIRTGPPRDPG